MEKKLKQKHGECKIGSLYGIGDAVCGERIGLCGKGMVLSPSEGMMDSQSD